MHDNKNFITILECILTTKSFLHIGTSERNNTPKADNPFITVNIDGKRIPIIPGSSIKGHIRHAVLSIISRTNLNFHICKLHMDEITSEKRFYRDYRNTKGYNENADIRIQKKDCPICKIFGSTKQMSSIIVRTAFPVNVKEDFFQINTFTSIRPKTRTIKRGSLYSIESVKPNIKFEFEIIAYCLENPFMGILLSGIDLLENFSLGALKSRGYGKIDIKIKRVIFKSPSFYLFEDSDGIEILESEGAIRDWILYMKESLQNILL
ncbi:MAG: RAMP superfamily CRISPR-associated protein [Candidatus Helarchaeota archaeon]